MENVMVQEYQRDSYTITTDQANIDVDAVHSFLTQCYWSEGIPKKTVERSIRNSLCFSVLDGTTQIGFARVISDFATFAYLGDVYIVKSHRGKGLSKWLMSCILSHPDLQ